MVILAISLGSQAVAQQIPNALQNIDFDTLAVKTVEPILFKELNPLDYVSLTKESLSSFDCVVLVTDHDNFDYKFIEENSKLIVDTRGKFIPSDTIIRS